MGKKSDGKDIKVVKGKVIFDADEELDDVEASDEDVEAIVDTVKKIWTSYLHMDKAALGKLMADDVTRLSQRTRFVQQGVKAVLAGFDDEWQAFERPDNLIAEEMTLRSMEITVDDEEEATYANVLYWVEIEAGARWHYEDQGVILQVFSKDSGAWQLVYQTDVWSTDYDLDEDEPGEAPTFVFDYVYPVKDLAKAVEFYSPVLGTPDAVTKTRAFFGLRGPKFILDASGLHGFSEVRENLPNGYGVIYVEDIKAEQKKLSDKDVTFLGGSDEKLLDIGGDKGILIQDTAGNVVALAQKGSAGKVSGGPSIKGLDDSDDYVKAAKKIAWAWLTQDAKTIIKYHGEDSQWLDDTRTSTRGMEAGGADLKEALTDEYWPHYEASDEGLVIDMVASDVRTRKVGDYTIVSYLRTFEGKGLYPFREMAFVTHVFSDEETVDYTMIVSATRSNGFVVELDYTGHPVDDLEAAEDFYTNIMELGDPYVDEEWRGWWSNNTVYGAYTSDPDDDGIPVEGRTNGYVSFWVRSAQQTYDYFKSRGGQFPVIPSINEKKGLDVNPGYTQCVATDAEGNVAVFTEYSGKKK